MTVGQFPEPAIAGKCPVRSESTNHLGFSSPQGWMEGPLGCCESFQSLVVAKEWKKKIKIGRDKKASSDPSESSR